MKNKKLVIVGGGETADLAYEYFTHDSEYEVASFSVEKEYKKSDTFRGLPLEDFEFIERKYNVEEYYAFVAVSGAKLNRVRTKLYNATKSKGYKIASYISSKCFIGRNVEIGENNFILENNVIQSNVKIGSNVVLWSGNHIGHRSIIGDNCFISSHVVVSGFCEIGKNCFIGVNSCVSDGVRIADDNFIAIGSVISRSTERESFYKGNPAEKSSVNSKFFFKIKE